MNNSKEVEAVLDILKKEIEEEGIIFEEKVRFSEREYSVDNIPKKWEYCYAVDFNAPIVPHKKRFGKLEIFIKKAIRKVNKFWFLPILFFQNDYNKRAQEEINKLYDIVELQNKQIRDLEDKIEQYMN